MKTTKRKLKRKFSVKQLLFAGLVVWLPVVASIWIVGYIISITDSLMKLLPLAYRPENLLGFKIPGLGLILAVLVLLGTGLFTANVIGKRIVRLGDNAFSRIPFIKSIYFGVKKVSESIFSDSRESFKTPVLVQFPHQDSWTIGFITGAAPAIKAEKEKNTNVLDEDPYISVYIPTTPNPTSGYVIFVRKSATKHIDFSTEEALKYVISFGIMDKEKI